MRIRKKNPVYLVFLILLLMTGIGYASLGGSLTINGTGQIANSSWDVHFENPVATANSTVVPTTAPSAPALSKLQTISFAIPFNTPGQIYEFTVDVANRGSIDAMLNTITSTMSINGGTATDLTTNSLPSYLIYYVRYSDGASIGQKQRLLHGTTESLTIHVEFKRDINTTELSTVSGKTITFTYGLGYIQGDGTEIAVPHPDTFATDSWDTIIGAVQTGTTSAYAVGDTKEITLSLDLDEDGEPENHTYTVRIANKSTPSECSQPGFSQTACGFVLEFVQTVTDHTMNISASTSGGWRDSSMRTYLNDETQNVESIYNALPSNIRNAIIPTRVISGYGCTSGWHANTKKCDTPDNSGVNFDTTDKLYLLSPHEIWEDTDEDLEDGINFLDKSYNDTRQLDYYATINVTTSSYSAVTKSDGTTNRAWWSRSANASSGSKFFNAEGNGSSGDSVATTTNSVSPAFRLGPVT